MKMKEIKEFMSNNDLFVKYVGVELLEVSQGYARAKLKIENHHLNAVNIIQGGAIFTLADFVFAVASNSYGTVAVAINGNISFFKAISSGILYAEAKEISINSKLGTYLVNVIDENNDLIASFTGTVYRKKEQLLPDKN